MEDNKSLIRHLKTLSKQYSNIGQVAEEIINLQAILNLPKGTELFLSDIHGEYGSFSHILNNGSGIIKNKIERLSEPHITIARYVVKCLYLKISLYLKYNKLINKSQELIK